MRRHLPAAASLVLAAAYLVLAPADHGGFRTRLVQMCTLAPAALFAAWWLAGMTRRDLSAVASTILMKPSPALFAMTASVWVLLFCSWMALGPMGGIPRGGDETAYLFQSRIFAAGHAWAPAPPVPDPARTFPFRHFIFDQGRWFVMYTPLHAVMMAPFTAAGAHSLMGPLEGALSVAGAYILLRMLTGERRARQALALMVLSPFVLFMAATRMAHNSSLLLVTWALVLLVSAVRRRKPALCAPGGLLLGLAVAAKPYPDIVWWPFVIAALFAAMKRDARAYVAWAVAGALPAAALILGADVLYTGDAFSTPYEMARGGSLIGFGPDKAWFPVYGDHAHTPLRGLMNLLKQAGAGSVMLLGWPLLSFVPALMALPGAGRDRSRLWAAALVASFALLLCLHYSPSVDYGPRHYYTLVPPVMALSATGIAWAAARLRDRHGARGGSFALLSVAGLFAFTASVYVPQGIEDRSGPWMAIDDEVMRLAEEEAAAPAVIFMQASEHGYPNFISGVNHLSPFLDGDYIFCAHQTPEEDLEVMSTFPERQAFLFWFDGNRSHMEAWTPGRAAELVPVADMAEDPALNREGSGR